MKAASLTLAVVGPLTCDYVALPEGRVHSGILGGSAVYAAAGARVWCDKVGIVGRVGANFPEAHLHSIEDHGISARYVRQLPDALQQSSFFAYPQPWKRVSSNPARTFLQLGQPLPKALLDFEPAEESDPLEAFPAWAPRAEDIPDDLEGARAVHLSSGPYASQCTHLDRLRNLHLPVITLDPATDAVRTGRIDRLRNLMLGVDVFLASETQLHALFGPEARAGQTWPQRLQDAGCRVVVIKRGPSGQILSDGRTGESWQIPAYPAQIRDVTGAGHAYCGGFLAGWEATGDLLEAGLRGAVSASLAVEGVGPLYPLEAMPGLAEARLESLRPKARRLETWT